MKTKRAGFLTKLVILALLVIIASALLGLRTAQPQRAGGALYTVNFAQRDAQLQVNAPT